LLEHLLFFKHIEGNKRKRKPVDFFQFNVYKS
jgi:hypothetical protein